MTEIEPEDHGIVASISNILSTTDPIDQDILDLHEDIHEWVELIDETVEKLRRKYETKRNTWQRKIAREDDDLESVHDFNSSQKPWLELDNFLHNWKLLREGIPDWKEQYSKQDISLAVSEDELLEASEKLESYKAGLEDLKAGLESIQGYASELLRVSDPGKGNMAIAVEQARSELNDQISKMVELEKAAKTIESEMLEKSEALARKIIDEYETLQNPSFNDAEEFNYYVLSHQDDFKLLSYWIFHDEIDRVTLKPRKKTRYRVHTDRSLQIPHVNLYFEDRDGSHLIHVIPVSEAEAWEELLSSQS